MASAGGEGADRESTAGPQAAQTAQREQLFNQFYDSTDFLDTLRIFHSLCSEIGVDSAQYDDFYVSLKEKLTNWKAGALWQLLDARARLPEYENQRACSGKRVLVIGAGPVGLRAAVEAALLGARVDLVEKRTGFTRNNSLHLWPFLITDLRNLGAKKFYGKFASGAIDHICIRILQSVLLKVCLLLGVKVHPGITFTGLVEPKNTNSGWSITTSPASCPPSSYNYDIILAADGKQNSLPGFRTKEFRAKLALAITVNFVNHSTKQESSVPEISGVAYVYRQDFFNSMARELGIELENIVYYKDETHYFVMTAKKPSLLRRGVIKKDENDPKKLLAPENIDKKALERYATEATSYATEGALTNMEFEKNHRGENDVALFDFTSLFASENAARIIERKGKRILLCVAGDSLLEPFWPTGSGCARGFLGAFDAAWMMKRFAAGEDPVSLLEEREAILYLLPQTTPERLQKNLAGYTIDPKTRYMNLSELVPPGDVTHLYDTDDPNVVNALKSRGQSTSFRTSTKQEKPKAVAMTREEGTPKRSRSIEGLASKSQSLESPCDISASETSAATSEANAQQAAQTARHFWQKKHGNKAVKSSASKGEKKKEGNAPPPSKPPLPSAAKEKKPGTSHMPAKTASSQKPSTKLPEKRPLHDVSSPEGVMKSTPPASPDLHGHSKKKKLALFKGRSRSESPERVPKASKKSSSKGSAYVAGHPLEAATSVKSLDRESEATAGENEGESAAKNVLEIIERYNKKDQSVSNQPKASGHDKTAAATSTADKIGKATTKGKASSTKQEASTGGKGGIKKEKEKDESSKSDKKKEASSGRGLKSFFKRGRAHDDEESTGKHPKKKAKKDKDKATENSKMADKKSSEPHQLTIKSRIEKLKGSGVYTDGSEDTDSAPVVLLSVTRHKEEEQTESFDNLRQRESKSPSPIEGGGEEGENPLEEQVEVFRDDAGEEVCVDSGGESREGESESTDAVDRVKRLQSLFQPHDAEVLPRKASGFGRSYSTSDTRRSKEIDLSDLLIRKTQSYDEATHPLWLARIIQNLNKCLERLRKDNDIMVAKTALVILNTIISNVQSHPDDDVYRRVRVSSDRFHKKVWQFSDARQFLARAGWVEIDDFIVLPISSKVDVPKRVLDKHLNIVNQMLWSRQLELPDSPGVLKRRRAPRDRSRTLMKRSSYATLLVEESLERIEEDEQAMAAARTKRRGSETSVSQPQGEEKERGEAAVEDGAIEDYLNSRFVPESRVEEVQTMKAASAARSIWMQREVKKGETVKEREYRLVLETELYDLPAPPTATDERMDARQRSKSPEDMPISFVAGGGVAQSQYDRQRSTSSRVAVLAEVPECENEENEIVENGNGRMENGNETGPDRTEPVGGTVEDRVKKLTTTRSNPSLLTQQSGNATVVENGHKDVVMVTFEDGSRDEEHTLEDKNEPQAQADITTAPPPSTQGSKESAPTLSVPSKKFHDSPSSDQLKQLLAQSATTGTSPSDKSNREGKSPSPAAPGDEPQKSKADAQHPTESVIMSGRLEYEKLAIQAAAETRQKWMETEASQLSSQKDDRELSYL